MIEWMAENSKAVLTVITAILIPVVTILFRIARSISSKRKIKNAGDLVCFLDTFVASSLHEQHHMRGKQARLVKKVIRTYAEHALAETDNMEVLSDMFPNLPENDLNNYGRMYRQISKDVFYGPFYEEVMYSVYEDQIHTLSAEEYENHIQVNIESLFLSYWEELRTLLPPDFYCRIDEVKNGLEKNMDTVEKFVRTMFDTAKNVALESEHKKSSRREQAVKDITSKLNVVL